MQCSFCKKEHVDKIFYMNIADTIYQFPICNECLQKRWQLAVSAGQADAFKKNTGWRPGQPDPRHPGDQPFPELAVEGLRTCRRLKALSSRLDEAAKLEHYEEAAKLRDDIAIIKEGRCSHGNES